MAEEQQEYSYELMGKLRDIEEKQSLTRDRVLLIGKNLIDAREKSKEEIEELKIEVEKLTKEMTKLKDVVQNIMEELDEFARKSELDSIQKQMNIFSPLNLARIEDVEKMITKHKH